MESYAAWYVRQQNNPHLIKSRSRKPMDVVFVRFMSRIVRMFHPSRSSKRMLGSASNS